jgi:hypothetical protein
MRSWPATPMQTARCCRARSASRPWTTQVFRQRAAALVGALAPVLVWVRDHKGVLLNVDTVRLSFELRSIWKVATKRVFEVRKLISGETTDIPIPKMPQDLLSPTKTCLKRTSGLRHEAGPGPAENRGAGEAACLRPGGT